METKGVGTLESPREAAAVGHGDVAMKSAADGNREDRQLDTRDSVGAKRSVFAVLLVVVLGMMLYGALLGNVFETYHNASTL